MADLTHLDAKSLQTFLDVDVAAFIEELKKIRQDDWAAALKSILEGKVTSSTLQQNPILALGLMASGQNDPVFGAGLINAVKADAQSFDDVLAFQQQLFKDIDKDLQTTIETLLKTQGASLESIDGEKLLDPFSDVENDLSEAGKGSGSGNSSS
ncbi:type VII secretion system-associated protein [Streptomyces sp. NPDC000880]